MAAGLGFKDFTTGEVLTAADVDGYLMQGIWVFASAAARDAAVTSPQEGNFAYLKDTNTTTYYTGSAWTNLDTTGMVNPMTTTGDTIYSSSGSTPARLGIGSTGQVLTVSGGVPAWTTLSSGSMTLLSTTTLSGASTTISGISGSYQDLLIQIEGFSFTNGTGYIGFEPNSTTDLGTVNFVFNAAAATAYSDYIQTLTASKYFLTSTKHTTTNGNTNNQIYMYIRNYASSSKKIVTSSGYANFTTIGDALFTMHGFIDLNSAISSLKLTPLVAGGTTFTAGTVKIYGVN